MLHTGPLKLQRDTENTSKNKEYGTFCILTADAVDRFINNYFVQGANIISLTCNLLHLVDIYSELYKKKGKKKHGWSVFPKRFGLTVGCGEEYMILGDQETFDQVRHYEIKEEAEVTVTFAETTHV